MLNITCRFQLRLSHLGFKTPNEIILIDLNRYKINKIEGIN